MPFPAPSAFLGKIKEAFDRNPGLQNLLLDDFFRAAVEQSQVRAIEGLWDHRGSCGTGSDSIQVICGPGEGQDHQGPCRNTLKDRVVVPYGASGKTGSGSPVGASWA